MFSLQESLFFPNFKLSLSFGVLSGSACYTEVLISTSHHASLSLVQVELSDFERQFPVLEASRHSPVYVERVAIEDCFGAAKQPAGPKVCAWRTASMTATVPFPSQQTYFAHGLCYDTHTDNQDGSGAQDSVWAGGACGANI